jgi:DNA-directed RNA polymerase specialized sigma54-like protein
MLMDNSIEVKDKALSSIKEAQDMTMHRIQDLQKQVETLDKNTRERIAKLENVAQEIVDEQKTTLEQGVTKAKEVLSSQSSKN